MRLLLGYLSDLRCEEVGAGATALQSEESPALSSFEGKKSHSSSHHALFFLHREK